MCLLYISLASFALLLQHHGCGLWMICVHTNLSILQSISNTLWVDTLKLHSGDSSLYVNYRLP